MRESIEIVVSSSGARRVRRDLQDIGSASRRTHTAVELLKRGLAALGGFYAVREIARAVDQYNSLNNRLSVVSGSIDQVKSSYAELLAISNRTLIPLQETTVLFQRAAIAADQLGASNKDLFKFVETVGQALAIQGGTASTARGALLQLSQAIGTDIVRAEEFNSILEGAFPIALAAARGIDEAAGSVARLRKMVINGEVTSRQFFDAIMSQSDELAAQFAKITPTMAQGFNVLSNGWVTFIGRLDESLGISRAISQSMIWLGENMMEVGNAAIAGAVGLTVLFGPAMLAMVNKLIARVVVFNATLLANPLIALAAAVATVLTYLVLMRKELKLGTDGFQTLSDLLTVFWLDTKMIFGDLMDVLDDWFGPAIDSVRDFLSEYDLSIVGVMRATADVGDSVVGIYIGAYKAIIAVWERFPDAFMSTLRSTLQPAADLFQDFINEMIEASNSLRSVVGLDPFDLVNFDLGGGGGGGLKSLGAVAGEAFMEGFEGSTGIRDYLEGAIERSQLITAPRLIAEGQTAPDVTREAPGGSGDGGKDAAKRAAKLANELESLVRQYDAVAGAAMDLAAADDVLARAVESNLISQERANELYRRAADALADQLDPLGAVNRELAKEKDALFLSTAQREVYNRVEAISNDLKSSGIYLTDDQTRALREQVAELESLTALEAERNRILESVRGNLDAYNLGTRALNSLLADGSINLEQYNKEMAKLKENLPGVSNEFDLFAENMAKNSQNILADFLFDPFKEGLSGMADAFAVMVQRMVAEAVAADLARRLFGSAGGGTGSGWVGAAMGAAAGFLGGGTPVQGGFMSEVMAFDGGGYTGDGPRSGGLDGKGGYMAMVHPQETVIDHTKSGSGETKQNITNNFILQERKDNRTQSQIAMQAAASQRRANARFGS